MYHKSHKPFLGEGECPMWEVGYECIVVDHVVLTYNHIFWVYFMDTIIYDCCRFGKRINWLVTYVVWGWAEFWAFYNSLMKKKECCEATLSLFLLPAYTVALTLFVNVALKRKTYKWNWLWMDLALEDSLTSPEQISGHSWSTDCGPLMNWGH